MNVIFEIVDKNGKKIRLTDKQYSHLIEEHPYMHNYLEEIKETLQKPDKITFYSFDQAVRYFYRGYKYFDKPNRYLLVIVKYLNGEGYVISSYLESKIK
ncbi:MAG: PBECR2 nuclease fold domain-containing protein [Nanoarchaeota archaeon]